MPNSNWDRKSVRKLLFCPGAANELSDCIIKVYKSLDNDEREQVDQVGNVILKNLEKKYENRPVKFNIGKISLAVIAIRLSILMIEWNITEVSQLRELTGCQEIEFMTFEKLRMQKNER